MRWILSLSLCAFMAPVVGGCVVKEKETVREQPVVEKRVEVHERTTPNPKVEVNVDR